MRYAHWLKSSRFLPDEDIFLWSFHASSLVCLSKDSLLLPQWDSTLKSRKSQCFSYSVVQSALPRIPLLMSRREVHEMVELPLANKLRRLKTHFAFTIWPLHSIKEFLFRFALTPFLKSVVFDHKLSLPLETVRLFIPKIQVSQTPAKAEKSEKRIKRAPFSVRRSTSWLS